MISVYDRTKEIEYKGDMEICPSCGRYCSYRLFVTYTCLSLFFIPILKWGKSYYLRSSCCGKTIELDKEQGKKFEKGMQ